MLYLTFNEGALAFRFINIPVPEKKAFGKDVCVGVCVCGTCMCVCFKTKRGGSVCLCMGHLKPKRCVRLFRILCASLQFHPRACGG